MEILTPATLEAQKEDEKQKDDDGIDPTQGTAPEASLETESDPEASEEGGIEEF